MRVKACVCVFVICPTTQTASDVAKSTLADGAERESLFFTTRCLLPKQDFPLAVFATRCCCLCPLLIPFFHNPGAVLLPSLARLDLAL